MIEKSLQRRRWSWLVVFCVLLTLTFFSSNTLAATPCPNLTNLVLLDTTITLAESLPAGSNPAPSVINGGIPVAICRVVAHIHPSSDSDIEMEVWMPSTGWNGKFLGTGTGKFYGQIQYDQLLYGISRNYAVVASDMGHKSAQDDANWAFGHPEKLTDFMYRAVHEMTLKGKAIAQAFYGPAPTRSYWAGCSTAGNQGLKEALLYPQDYDGITVYAPVNNWSKQEAAHLYNALSTFKNGTSSPEYIPPEKWPFITTAALNACDARDGLADGLVAEPFSCDFDPGTLLCPFGGNATSCLTPAQVQTARKIYAGAKYSNGQTFFPGLPPSGETQWAPAVGGPEPYAVATSHFKYLVFGNPSWDWRTFNPDTGVPLAQSVQAAGLDSMDPNLAPFKARGGKVIMTHGWLDTSVFAKNSVDYYQSVINTMGSAPQTTDFFRLFMAPGVDHCGAGPGPGVIDDLTALEQWVELAIPPNQIIAEHYASTTVVDRRRLLCAYPQVGVYNGSGDINAWQNFNCQYPTVPIPRAVAAFSGTPQTVPATTNFVALQARVTDANSNPVVGVPVTFTAPSTSASATFKGTNSITVNTNASGIATTPVPLANHTTGSYNVTASFPGVTIPATFTLTNTPVSVGLTIFGPTTPATVFVNSASVELGVKFRSELAGNIMGVRFYKAAGDNTAHTGTLWSAAGAVLATGAFTGETASGWQTLTFSTPVAINANTTYVASYHTAGSYGQTTNAFQNAGVDRSPLHALKDGIDGFNGVFINGSGGSFPNQGFASSNFWADVVFLPTVVLGSGFSDITPPAISAVSVTSITAATAILNWTTDEAADGQVEFVNPCPSAGCLTSLVTAFTTQHRIAVAGLIANTLYTYRIVSKDNVGNVGFTPNQTFKTAPGNFTTSTLWPNTTNPTTPSDSDNRAIEVGVKFRSDVAGLISAIRFYKGSLNTGTHTASLWTASGTLLARAVSWGESASGWQQVDFPAVNINANTTYIASYHTTSGHYSFNGNYFNSQYNSGVLHGLADGTSGGNGLWQTSAAPTFPTQNYLAGNFWVDVIFGTPPMADSSAPVISGISATNITSTSAIINWTTDEPADGQVEIVSPCAVSPCLTSLVSALTTSHAITLTGLTANTMYAYRIRSRDGSLNLATTSNLTFTTASVNATSYSLWTNVAMPTTANAADSRAIEVGVKFKSDIDGFISAIRFYKGSQNTGTHTASLWTTAGVNLAQVVSSGETASGWQQINLPSPVVVTANTTYIASYHTTSGSYSFNSNYFSSQYDSLPLHALADAPSGGNGIFLVSNVPIFPNQTFQSGNFWVDVLFSTASAPASDTTPPGVSGISVTNITSSGATVNWTTNEAADGQLQIVSPCASSPCLTTLVSAFTTSHSITLSSLNPSTLYTYRIRSKDSSNNLTITSDQTFSTTAPVDSTPPVISNIAVTILGSSYAELNWTTDEPATGNIEIMSPCATSPCLTPTSLVLAFSTSHTIALSGLNPNTLYTYRILSMDPSHNQAISSNQIFTTLPVISTMYSLWTNSTSPATPNANDNRAIEVGVKFKSDVDGFITAIRFYKGTQNTGTHTVSLWSAAGVLLGRGVSSGETASGWQQVTLAPAVSINANATYVASYFTTSGFYAFSPNYFGVQFNNGPLHGLADGTSGGNGLYQVNGSPIFPTQDYIAGNFWVDVVLGAGATDSTSPVVSGISVTNITTSGVTVNWTTDEPATGQVEILSPCASSPCLTSLVSTLSTSHAITLGGLTANTPVTYRILSKDAANNQAVSSNQTFTTAAAVVTTYSLWTNTTTPATPSAADARAIEVGVKFKADSDGVVSAVRFYKGPQNTGTHTVSLWSVAGVLLGRVVSSGETASGWQQVTLPSPVSISANATYIASYHTTSGFYAFNGNYFGNQFNNAPLHGLADGPSGGNGLFQVSSSPIFPTQTYSSGNFWVDVIFGAGSGPPPDSTPPAISAISATNITSSGATINWTTDEPADGQVEIISPCSSAPCLSPLVSALSTSHAITLSSLNANTQYTYQIRSKDALLNQAVSSNQTFTTSGGAPTTPPNAPSNLVATCNTATQVALSWSPTPTATSYYLRVNNQTTSTLEYSLDDYPQTSFTGTVQAGNSYTWWVHAANSAGLSKSTLGTFSCP